MVITKQQEQQQHTTTKKKSYVQLLKEAEETSKKVAAVYVRQLCEALRDENPNMTHAEIREKVFEDCSAIGWGGKTGSTIYHNFPSWLVEDDPLHQAQVKRWEGRHAKALESGAESAAKLSQDLKDVPLPPESRLPKEKIIEEDETFSQEMQELGIAPYGETGRSTRDLTGDISLHAYKLFAALTNNTSPPNKSSDLLVDYIRPSREFRRGLMLEVDRSRRAAIHNALHYASVAIEDMIEIIDEIDRKEQ